MQHRSAIAGDGTTIAYDDAGPPGGVPVLLVHGLAAAGAQFHADAQYFAGLGFRVLVPDLRGHGRSAVAGEPDPEGFAIATMAADLEAVLAHAGVAACHWVGNSLGGILGLALMGRRPDLFLSFASFGTAHALDLPGVVPFGFPLAYRLLGPRLAGAATAVFTTRNRAARPLIAACVAGFDPAVGRAIATHLRRYDLTGAALAHEGPMLLLRGRGDVLVNRALAASLPALLGRPGFSLVELEKGGHCANLDDTEAFRAALLAFWQGITAAPSAPGTP